MNMTFCRKFAVELLTSALLVLGGASAAASQESGPMAAPNAASIASGDAAPSTALAAVLGAACRADETQFANYLTADNAVAFRALPEEERSAFIKRFSLTDLPGKILSSSDAQNQTVLRCETPQATIEFRFETARTHENLAFITVSVVDSEKAEFGLVRENGGWHLLSLGLVLLNVPELSKQWAAADDAARENTVADTVRKLADSIQSYKEVFGKLPDSLAQLGPAPKDQISADRAALVDEHLAAGTEDGYSFRYRIVNGENSELSFELVATPETYSKKDRVSFFLDAAGKLHAADKHGESSDADDPVLADDDRSQ
jgi:hypothetical protein